jgi:hypothetical protein
MLGPRARILATLARSNFRFSAGRISRRSADQLQAQEVDERELGASLIQESPPAGGPTGLGGSPTPPADGPSDSQDTPDADETSTSYSTGEKNK